ncbi:hypothetical protein AAFC00_003908 [Neodothiora populina]|uniref:Cytochrome P450 n=1 Tax=Neodothiora populina TaxID=2781224 RepID=A0ABR3PFS5_9PEZI
MFAIICVLLVFVVYYFVLQPFLISPLRKIPGPKSYAITKWRLAFEDYRGRRTRSIDSLHRKYGPVVRIGPNEVHFNSSTSLRKIYGAGSGFERTSFYRMFDVYGKQNLFTFESSKAHGARKKLLAHAYSKSEMLTSISPMIESRVQEYMEFLQNHIDKPNDIFTTLHYFSLDSITHFLYGAKFGGTFAVTGNAAHRALLLDILDPSRPTMEKMIAPLLPMSKPATYTAIRAHALQAFEMSKQAVAKNGLDDIKGQALIADLWPHHQRNKSGGLDDLELASECADHLLAGIDTTADSLMFLIWVLSLPENEMVQQKLSREVRNVSPDSPSHDFPSVRSAAQLPYLDAVIKETLRLYSPLPASEPRCMPNQATVIDGYSIPAGTIVCASAYSINRNDNVYEDPLEFDPDRWLDEKGQMTAKSSFAFSAGGRMCIGMHLATAEMTTLVTAIYRNYTTHIAPGFEGKSPAITSRFELFFDESMPHIEEHTCMINFKKIV